MGDAPASERERIDWTGNPPPSLIALRRDELRHARRVAIAKVVGAGALVAAGLAITLISLVGGRMSGMGLLVIMVSWGVRWLIPNVSAVRAMTHELDRLQPPELPEARVVIR